MGQLLRLPRKNPCPGCGEPMVIRDSTVAILCGGGQRPCVQLTEKQARFRGVLDDPKAHVDASFALAEALGVPAGARPRPATPEAYDRAAERVLADRPRPTFTVAELEAQVELRRRHLAEAEAALRAAISGDGTVA